jgi:hypothetical protein
MKRRDRRHVEGANEIEDVRSVLAAPRLEVVLDGDDVGAVAEGAGDAGVVIRLVAANPMVDLAGIWRERLGRVEGDDLGPSRGGSEVASERGDAAAMGGIRGDEGVAQDAGCSSRRVAVGRFPRTGADSADCAAGSETRTAAIA